MRADASRQDWVGVVEVCYSNDLVGSLEAVTASACRPRVLVAVGHYLPSYRSGGPVRSIAAWVAHLGDDLDISVVCLDRDLGEHTPYPGVPIGTWVRHDRCRVLYLPPRAFNLFRAHRLLRETVPETVYLNSLFSVSFAINFLLAARLVRPRPKIVLAPRGQLDPSALGLKRMKKQVFLDVCRPLRIFRDVHWQASSDVEADQIRRNFGPDVAVTVARNLHVPSDVPRPAGDKRPGRLRVVFLSRIAPMKNLRFALTLFEHLRGTVTLTIAGPVDDPEYWARCQPAIQNAPPNVTIDYRGPVPNEEVAGVLADHDLLLLPTLSENFGHVIVEALQVGTPVLISDRTPWHGLAQHDAGWDLPLDAPASFVAALQDCIDLGPDEFRRLSSGARAMARRVHDDTAAIDANRALFGLAPTERSSVPK